jgi:hypothetical protein
VRFEVYSFGLLVLLAGVFLCRGLLTGAVGFGAAAVRRAEDPARYWFELAHLGLLVLAFGWLIWRPVGHGEDELSRFNPIPLLLGPQLAFWLVRSLRRGRAPFYNPACFSRAGQPLRYWLLLTLAAAFMIALIWISLPRSWT